MNLPWRKSPEDHAETVRRLEVRRSEAVAEFEKARGEIGKAILEADEKNSKEAFAYRDRVRASLERGQSVITETDLALQVAKERHAEATSCRERQKVAKQWEEVEALTQQRVELADEIVKDIETLCAKRARMLKLSTDAFFASPKPPEGGLAGTSLSVEYVDYAIRLQLLKSGCMWAAKWPWGVDSAPALPEKVQAGNEWIFTTRVPEIRDAEENASEEIQFSKA